MAGFLSQVNYWRTDPSLPLHTDETAGMAEIYPVPSPQWPSIPPLGLQALPIINATGRIEGTVTVVNHPTVRSPFGLNIMPLPRIPNQNPAPQPAPVGRIVGTSRLMAGLGVVGFADTATGAYCTGDFVMDGVPPGSAYDMGVQPMESDGIGLGLPSPAANYGEWMLHATHNATLNLPWRMPTFSGGPLSFRLQCAAPHPTSLGTLHVVPGTVIQLPIVIDINSGFTQTVTENVTRPVVSVDNRTGLPASGSITASVTHDYRLDRSTATWYVGATAKPAGAYAFSNEHPTGPGPFTTSWQVSPSAIGLSSGSTLRFIVRELPYSGTPDAGLPPAGVTPLFGINEVKY
jgi:hypothetical protein